MIDLRGSSRPRPPLHLHYALEAGCTSTFRPHQLSLPAFNPHANTQWLPNRPVARSSPVDAPYSSSVSLASEPSAIMDSLARPIPVSAPGSAPHMEYPEDPSFHSPHDGRVEMSQDEIDAIIRNKRKLRDPKACYACHRRKVKCDRNLPCDSCIKRDHPELCSYERPTKRRRIALPGVAVQPDAGHSDGPDAFVLNSGPNVTVPKEQWERVQRELQQLREAVKGPHSPLQSFAHDDTEEHLHTAGSGSRDETEREGIHAESKQMGTMHLGSKSVLAYMMGLGRTKSTQDAARSLLEKDILPNLGLDNDSATYPFVDLWSTESSMQDVDGLCRAIPEDRLCRESVHSLTAILFSANHVQVLHCLS